jgi:hypothetical protein
MRQISAPGQYSALDNENKVAIEGQAHTERKVYACPPPILIRNLLWRYRERLRRLISKAVRAVYRSLRAEKTTRSDMARR